MRENEAKAEIANWERKAKLWEDKNVFEEGSYDEIEKFQRFCARMEDDLSVLRWIASK